MSAKKIYVHGLSAMVIVVFFVLACATSPAPEIYTYQLSVDYDENTNEFIITNNDSVDYNNIRFTVIACKNVLARERPYLLSDYYLAAGATYNISGELFENEIVEGGIEASYKLKKLQANGSAPDINMWWDGGTFEHKF